MDERQYFIDAVLRYEELLETGTLLGLDTFVAGEPAHLRAELRAFLEFSLTIGDLDEPLALTAEQIARADTLIAQVQASFTASDASLTQLRSTHGLTVGRLARLLALPVDLLARIERGKVAFFTVPVKLVEQLATALELSEAAVRAAFYVAPPQASARLSAVDSVQESDEPVVSFAQALAESDPTAEQLATWGELDH